MTFSFLPEPGARRLRCLTCSRVGTRLVMLVGGRVPLAKETAMSNRYARILAAGGAAVLVAALGVTTALAAATAKTWTIQPGGGVQAKAMTDGVTLIDATTGTLLKCLSTTASGTLKSGSGLPGADAGSLSAVSIGHCFGPGGGPTFVPKPAGLPWHVNLSSYNAADGVARGTISHLAITVTGNGCSLVIDGTSATGSDGWVRFTYSDSTGRLTVLATSGNLHYYDVTAGCLGLFDSGDRARLGATFTVTPKQAITSP
jgi:hypothetical protein